MKIYPSVVENIAHNASLYPDKLAIADEKTSLTYSQLWKTILTLSEKLKVYGMKKDACAVVECTQNTSYMICEFAIQLTGGIFVPIEKNASYDRSKEILNDTNALIHIGKSELSANKNTVFISTEEIAAICDQIPSAIDIHSFDDIKFPLGNDTAEILFSTGTTGKSKGIVLSHTNDTALAENVILGVKMKKDNIEMIPMPLSHSHGLRRTYANLVNGSSAVFVDGVTLLKKVFDLMDMYKVTSMDLSPSMLSIIFKLSKDRLGDYADILDYIQLGSAPLPEEDKLHLSRILPHTRLYNFYGSTEAGCSCILDFNLLSGRPGCIGKPAKNAHFIVTDKDGNKIESSKEHPGFLASSGPINMKCYFNAPKLTAEATKGGTEYIYQRPRIYR